jgi:anthranilate phosphoribosyltransferase
VGGDSIEESAKVFLNVLQGKGTAPQNNVVCANAGIAIATVKGISPREGFEEARESLLSGRGLATLNKLQQLSQ